MLSYIHKTHNKDRYRTIFCDEVFYKNHQDNFKLWKERFSGLSPVEKLQAWTIALSCLRRPQDWFAGKRTRPLLESTSEFQHSLTLAQLFLDTPVKLSPKLPRDLNLTDFINEYQIKALPESCFRSLCFILNGRYPLEITNVVPTPEELLRLQIAGRRIVSLNEEYETWPHQLYAQRDFLGFVLHDLIHADHFFFEPSHRDGQLGFYRMIENILPHPELQKLLLSTKFREGFEYIISDMNSHSVHLFQTLHAVLFSELKNDEAAEKLWREWFARDALSENERKAVNQINTSEFSGASARLLEILCIRLGQSASHEVNLR